MGFIPEVTKSDQRKLPGSGLKAKSGERARQKSLRDCYREVIDFSKHLKKAETIRECLQILDMWIERLIDIEKVNPSAYKLAQALFQMKINRLKRELRGAC